MSKAPKLPPGYDPRKDRAVPAVLKLSRGGMVPRKIAKTLDLGLDRVNAILEAHEAE